MAYLGSWDIDDFLTFPVNTHNVDTSVATDADTVPSYRVYEDETGTAIATGSMAKLDDTNTTGFYTERMELTAASGFESGKSYTIYISAEVNSVMGTTAHTFQIGAKVESGVTAAIAAYDAPTKAEMDAAFAALNDVSTAEVNAQVDSALADYDAPTKTEMDSAFSALNDLSAAQVNSEVDTALSDYDAPTKAELDSGFAALNNISTADVNAQVVDALNVDTYAEPGQTAPPATASLAVKIGYLFKSWRNKKDNDGSTVQLYADDGVTVDQKHALNEAGGTVTSGEWTSGP